MPRNWAIAQKIVMLYSVGDFAISVPCQRCKAGIDLRELGRTGAIISFWGVCFGDAMHSPYPAGDGSAAIFRSMLSKSRRVM
jgi:hypothetical protein